MFLKVNHFFKSPYMFRFLSGHLYYDLTLQVETKQVSIVIIEYSSIDFFLANQNILY